MVVAEVGKAGRKARRGVLFSLPILVTMALLPCARAAAGESAGAAGGAADPRLAGYSFGYANPLYATIAGYLSIKEPELKDQKSIKLKVPSFKKKIQVKAILQPSDAPLVVVLLGVDGRTDSPFGKLWPSWLGDAGYHVLTFDSTFLSGFVDISGHGVTGNVRVEAECVRDIIAAFLDLPEVRGKVQKIGIVGMSYGGLEALVLGQLAAAGKLPFKVEALQSYSPPVNLQKTGELLDKWHREDRWQYTLVELADKLSGHKPVAPDNPVPFDDSIMRAGIAALFRLSLADVVLRNNEVYKLGLLPKGNEFDDQYVKQEYAKLWGYTEFMNDMAFPYWEKKADLHSLSDLTGPIELSRLVENQPPYTLAIIAEDDPFNMPEDMAAFRKTAPKQEVIFLPRGGHLGYANEPWTRALLLSLFKGAERQTSAAPAPKP